MSNIINIAAGEIGGASVQTVNARELHAFLEVKSEFRNWIKNRIDDFGFVEKQDFTTVGKSLPSGGRQNDYFLTIDMAKELSMVERNDKGKQARQYFIECERRANAAVDPMVALNDPAAMRGLLLTYSEKVLALEDKITEQAPKVEAHDRIADSTGTLCLRDAAKALQMQPIKLNQWMQANNWIYRRLGKGAWTAYQERIQAGQLTHKLTPYFDEQTGDNRVSEQVRVTGKGLTLLAKRLNVELGPADVPVGMLVTAPPILGSVRV